MNRYPNLSVNYPTLLYYDSGGTDGWTRHKATQRGGFSRSGVLPSAHAHGAAVEHQTRQAGRQAPAASDQPHIDEICPESPDGSRISVWPLPCVFYRSRQEFIISTQAERTRRWLGHIYRKKPSQHVLDNPVY